MLSGSDAALAIVFAPGAPLPSQNRAPGAASVCGGNTNAANYLDSQTVGGTTFNNATGGGTNNFISASPSPQPTELNDKLMPITRGALFPVVEIRVARELRTSLRSYYTANQFYPLSAALPNNTATSGTYRGYVPTATTPFLLAPDLAPYLPAWFTANNWQQFMVYAVAPRCTARLVPTAAPTAIDAPSLNCNNTADGTPPGSWLTVSGTGGIHSAVLPASYRLGAQARPCAGFADCLEVVGASNENIDAVDNYTYVKPVRSAANNDNLVVVAPP